MLGKLEGKYAIVTGAASGIGRATAIKFAHEGAKGVLCGDINIADAASTAAEINESYPGCAIALKVDVSCEKNTREMVDLCMEKFGGVDVYFSNAGVMPKYVEISDESEEAFMSTLRINTLSSFMAIKYGSEAMKKTGRGGSIICTASIAAMRSDLTPLQYTASKGAILAMVTSANDRLLLDNIRINALVPGGVMTPLYLSVAQGLQDQGLDMSHYDVKRYPPIDPEEIAEVVAFLASDVSHGELLVLSE